MADIYDADAFLSLVFSVLDVLCSFGKRSILESSDSMGHCANHFDTISSVSNYHDIICFTFHVSRYSNRRFQPGLNHIPLEMAHFAPPAFIDPKVYTPPALLKRIY